MRLNGQTPRRYASARCRGSAGERALSDQWRRSYFYARQEHPTCRCRHGAGAGVGTDRYKIQDTSAREAAMLERTAAAVVPALDKTTDVDAALAALR